MIFSVPLTHVLLQEKLQKIEVDISTSIGVGETTTSRPTSRRCLWISGGLNLHQTQFYNLGKEVEVVKGYRYLGDQLDKRRDWKLNINAVYRKRQNRLCFVRKLGSFNVCSKMLQIV